MSEATSNLGRNANSSPGTVAPLVWAERVTLGSPDSQARVSGSHCRSGTPPEWLHAPPAGAPDRLVKSPQRLALDRLTCNSGTSATRSR